MSQPNVASTRSPEPARTTARQSCWRSGSPNFAEQPHPIVAEHLFDPRRTPAAAAEVGGQAVVAVGAVIAFDQIEDVGCLARRGNALALAVLEEAAMLGAHLIIYRVAHQR